MTVKVLLFSVLRDAAGTAGCDFETKPNARVSDLIEEVFARWPNLKAWDPSLLIAIDQTYVKREAALHEGAEVAIMPPVQGG